MNMNTNKTAPLPTITPEWLDAQIADLEVVSAELQASLEASCLDGNPFVLEMVGEDGHRLTYGQLYPDQTGYPGCAFRYHRRHDLCGAMMKTPESAKRGLALLTANLLAAGRTETPVVVHRRDWILRSIADLGKTIKHLKEAKTRLPAK